MGITMSLDSTTPIIRGVVGFTVVFLFLGFRAQLTLYSYNTTYS